MRPQPTRRRFLPRATTADLGVVLLVGLLCAFVTLGATATSGWLRVTADDMAAQAFEDAPLPARQLQVFYTEVSDSLVPPGAGAAVEQSLAASLKRVLGPPRHSVVTTETVPHALPTRPTDSPAFVTVVGFPDARALVDIVEGRFPRRGTREVLLPRDIAAAYDGPRRAPVVEVAIEREASKILNLPVGTYVDLVARSYRSSMPEAPTLLRVSGVYEPAADYPSGLDDMDNTRRPAVSALPEFNLVRSAVLAADDRTLLEAGWPVDPEVRWTFDVDGPPTAEAAEAVVEDARRLEVQPWPAVLESRASAASTGIGDLGSRFVTERDTSNALSALVLAALGSAALALLLVAAAVLEARRREVNGVLRARGASTRHLAMLRAAEAALLALPGLATAALLVPLTPLVAGDLLPALVAAATCVVLLSATQVAPWRELSDRARLAGRDALQIVTVALAVGVGTLMLWRDRLDATDPLLLGLPALVGAAGAIVATRAVQSSTARTRRLVGRGRRFAPLVGASQAGTAAKHMTLPVAGVVLATCCALLSVSVVDTLQRGADRAAWQVVGADVLVSGGRFDVELARRVEQLPGVTGLAGVRTANGILSTRSGFEQVTVVAVEPDALARVTREAPEPVRVPTSNEGHLDVVASTGLDLEGEETTLAYAQSTVPVRVTARLDGIPGVVDGTPFVAVDELAFRAAVDRPVSTYDALLISGNPDLGELRRVVQERSSIATVRARGQVTAQTLDDAAASRTLLVARVAGAASVLLALFAAGLAVALGGPLRRRTLLVLHALGADARQARWVSALELVPSMAGAGLAAGAGALLLTSVAGRGVDPAALTGSTHDLALALDPAAWVVAAALFTAAVVLVAAASARPGRRGHDKHLPDDGGTR